MRVLVDVRRMKPLISPRAPKRLRDRHARRVGETAAAAEEPAPAPAGRSPEQRARAAGGPEDRALYTCCCGAAFRADVAVDVPCPACGALQSW
jgi:hypothetical protein